MQVNQQKQPCLRITLLALSSRVPLQSQGGQLPCHVGSPLTPVVEGTDGTVALKWGLQSACHGSLKKWPASGPIAPNVSTARVHFFAKYISVLKSGNFSWAITKCYHAWAQVAQVKYTCSFMLGVSATFYHVWRTWPPVPHYYPLGIFCIVHTALLVKLCAHSVVLRDSLGGDWPSCCPTVLLLNRQWHGSHGGVEQRCIGRTARRAKKECNSEQWAE